MVAGAEEGLGSGGPDDGFAEGAAEPGLPLLVAPGLLFPPAGRRGGGHELGPGQHIRWPKARHVHAEFSPLVLGVDDFALRKGHVYGTVLVDIETRRPVDMLPERSAESFRAWLDAHPGVEIICRDRGGCYAEGAAQGAPLAIQVADRWHLWHNLAEAVERAVARHRPACKNRHADPEPGPPAAQPAAAPETGLAARTRARHAEIHAALARGLTITEISRTLRLERKTVRRYATAATADQLIGGARLTRPGLLGPHQAYLRQRWDEGIRSTERLHAELRARGYQGSLRTLRRLTARLRQDTAVPRRRQRPRPRRWPAGSSPRPATSPTTTAPRSRRSPPAARNSTPPATLVREFADMLCHRRGEHLEAWAAQAEASPVSELRGFAKGLRKDWAAVTAGLTVSYSSGAVEGHVNRIKMIKRQMYGRAKPDLLRKRVLLAD